jgi:hypothetical protein
MPKWTEYTSKNTLADNDEVMLYDATGRANKRGLMSKFWDYVVDKMATAVISKLETENKTVIGALNYLNGKTKTLLPKITADDEKELCEKIADIIMKNTDNTTIFAAWDKHFSVCVNVYYDRSEYFVYTVQTFDTSNRYICEYYKGTISIKK